MNRSENHSNLIIRASAGTGKTYQLSNRFLSLLLQGCAPDRILATTFTRKAAGEILDRVLLRLATAAATADGAAQLSTALGLELTEKQCQVKLRELTRMFHRVRVGTLDSFFGQVANSFSLEVGLPPAWEIADTNRDHMLRHRGIELLLGDDRDDASQETPLALVHLLTKGEAKRGISDMLAQTVNDAYTYFQDSNRSAWHSLQRIPPRDEDAYEALLEDLRTYDGTDEGLTGSQIAQIALQVDNTYNQAINETWDQMLVKGIMKNVVQGKSTFGRIEIPPRLMSILLQLVDHLRRHFVNQTASINESSYRMLLRFGGHYEQLKVAQGRFLFDDMPRLLTRVVQDESKAHLAFRIDGQIDHLLLDEFQDTSRVQWEALQPFARQIVDQSEHRSLFCVGDIKQAIYGWRGGMPEIFDRISSQFQVKESSLDESYRSASPVIEAVNAAFQGMQKHNNLGRLQDGVAQWANSFPKHSTAKKNFAGYVCLQVTASLREGEKAPEAVIRKSVDMVADFVTSHPGRSIGLLVRRNEMVARAIYQLKQRGIPASEEGGNPLTDSAAVLLICSVLKFADHPGDSVSAFHVCQSALAHHFGLSLEMRRNKSVLVRVAAQIRQQLLSRGYGACVEEWALNLQSECSSRESNRLRQLVTLAYRHESTLLPRDFVTVVETERVVDPSAASVRVMTIHQSKGLQFDIVILGELENKIDTTAKFVAEYDPETFSVERVCRYMGDGIRALLPTRFQVMHDNTTTRLVREQLCLLYVAMTRAKFALHLIAAPADSDSKSKSSAKTYAGLLRAGLCANRPLGPGTIAYELGDPDWSQKMPLPENWASEHPLSEFRFPRVQLAPMSENAIRRLRTTSPSRLEGGNLVSLRSRLSGQSDALLLGTLFHAWFELIEWMDTGTPSEADLLRVGLRVGVAKPLIQSTLKQFRKSLNSTSSQTILAQKKYNEYLLNLGLVSQLELNGDTQVRNEQRISVHRDSTLLNGSIDRLVTIRQKGQIVAADIIDYKTDRLVVSKTQSRDEALADKVSYYRPQLKAYRDAVCQMLRLDPGRIGARLVFTLEDEIVPISFDDLPITTTTTQEAAHRPNKPMQKKMKTIPRHSALKPSSSETSKESPPDDDNPDDTPDDGSPRQLRLF